MPKNSAAMIINRMHTRLKSKLCNDRTNKSNKDKNSLEASKFTKKRIRNRKFIFPHKNYDHYVINDIQYALSKFAELGFASQASVLMQNREIQSKNQPLRDFCDTSILRWSKNDKYQTYYKEQQKKFIYKEKIKSFKKNYQKKLISVTTKIEQTPAEPKKPIKSSVKKALSCTYTPLSSCYSTRSKRKLLIWDDIKPIEIDDSCVDSDVVD